VRIEDAKTFLETVGWEHAEIDPLKGDASFRRYARLERNGETAMLMDAPPDKEDVTPFVAIARHLKALGLSAPEIIAEDPSQGFLLLEDFGDGTFTNLLSNGGNEETLYAQAIDVLIDLHKRAEKEAVPQGLPRYDAGKLLEEARLLTDWFMPAVLDRETPYVIAEEYDYLWMALFPFVTQAPRTLVLRDYHVDNLMILSDRDGVAACGLLDFQDALAGHPAYDLVSLLEDARRDIGDRLIAAMLERYKAAFPDLDTEAFDAAYAILGAQRHAKVIGIFTRLMVRDGKPIYLEHIPRVWRLLERSCEHPALASIKGWLDRNIPSELRRAPQNGH